MDDSAIDGDDNTSSDCWLYLAISSTYIVTQHTLLYIGYFTLHKSDVINDDEVLYCIECCTPQGYYLKWNDDPEIFRVRPL